MTTDNDNKGQIGPFPEPTEPIIVDTPPRKACDRVCVVEAIYHLPYGEQAVAVNNRFERELVTVQQLYNRRLTIGEDPRPLDLGWIEDGVSYISIANEEGKSLQRIPTEKEQADIDARVVELYYEGDCVHTWLIPPGESMRAAPSHADQLMIRCKRGKARIILNVFPR